MVRFPRSFVVTLIASIALITATTTTWAFVVVPSVAIHRRCPVAASSTTRRRATGGGREDEIRRKIASLKRDGRLKGGGGGGGAPSETPSSSGGGTDYGDKVTKRLGGVSKARAAESRMGRSIRGVDLSTSDDGDGRPTCADDDRADDEDEDEMSEDDENLLNVVAERMAAKEAREKTTVTTTIDTSTVATTTTTSATSDDDANDDDDDDVSPKQTTSGVGGSWSPPSSSSSSSSSPEADYVPSRGSWGAFPRPKDISKAYGGGKRIGAGFDEGLDDLEKATKTQRLLRDYNRKVGIDVPSETENADEIDEALDLAFRAMQRGMYGTAVSSLEKVTQYCSTNSRTGSKVFLELAMAYEAVGRSDEAIVVYKTLSNSRNDKARNNARRLLSGIEAMNFMRDEVGASTFSTDVAAVEYIKATGLDRFTENFDDRYNTAYVDLESRGFYKRLTQAVVRSPREARQILLRARGSGEVDRARVVQALRSVSRRFDEALSAEKETAAREGEPRAVMNGVVIADAAASRSSASERRTVDAAADGFALLSPDDVRANLDGEWRLQLVADREGDAVDYFNSTLSWQRVDAAAGGYDALCPSGPFRRCRHEGRLSFDGPNRAVTRSMDSVTGVPAFLADAVLGTDDAGRRGAPAALLSPQQILLVDSTLCVTRRFGKSTTNNNNNKSAWSAADNVKDFYCVWRRVETGTYSEQRPSSSSSQP